jgi:hypothetical protein
MIILIHSLVQKVGLFYEPNSLEDLTSELNHQCTFFFISIQGKQLACPIIIKILH